MGDDGLSRVALLKAAAGGPGSVLVVSALRPLAHRLLHCLLCLASGVNVGSILLLMLEHLARGVALSMVRSAGRAGRHGEVSIPC